jgi:site-specific DNA-methyltransferase (adenine-specific)
MEKIMKADTKLSVLNTIILGDCLEVMKDIPDKSVDMILCDLPYGTTACKWDTIIPFEPLWKEYERIIKDNGAIVLTASQPFTSILVNSNLRLFRHEWIWHKDKSGNFMNCKFEPMKVHEHVLIFGKKKGIYNPQMEKRLEENKRKNNPRVNSNNITNSSTYITDDKGNEDYKYPTSVKYFNSMRGKLHPTQKPVALFEYLIKTYTNENDLVLDNCAGSGTTGVACKKSNRNFIMIEKEPEYCKIAEDRLKQEVLL